MDNTKLLTTLGIERGQTKQKSTQKTKKRDYADPTKNRDELRSYTDPTNKQV